VFGKGNAWHESIAGRYAQVQTRIWAFLFDDPTRVVILKPAVLVWAG